MTKETKKTPLKKGPKFKYGKVKGKVIGLYTSVDNIKKLTQIAKKKKVSRTNVINDILLNYFTQNHV